MREIKFRGFSKGVMHVGATLDDMLTSDGAAGFKSDPSIVWMQFTGLTDDSKQKKEAYEGDLIKCQLGCVRVIEFIGGAFVGVDPDRDFDDLVLSEYHFEIIGNKFQNPELLEQSK